MLEKLSERNFDLLRVLFYLKQDLDIYRIIAVNVEKINSSGAGKSFFAYVQKLALDSAVVNICKLVEIEKRHELNSIPGVIQYLQKEKIKCENSEPISDFIKNNNSEYKEGHEIGTLKAIFEFFCSKNSAELKRLKDFRDKRLAHIENISELSKASLPSYAIMEKFLNFGVEFYSTVQHAYAKSFPIQLDHEQKVLVGLLHLLELKGIKDIEKNFRD
jgi:hypothetical protein